MEKKSNAFTINTLEQAENIISEIKIYKITPIIHFRTYFLKGFGSEFILTFNNILINKYGKSNFKLFVDCGYDQSLAIHMISKKIDYIKILGDSIILYKIKNIAQRNKVLLNPSFNIVDCRNIKNIYSKLKKIYFKEIK